MGRIGVASISGYCRSITERGGLEEAVGGGRRKNERGKRGVTFPPREEEERSGAVCAEHWRGAGRGSKGENVEGCGKY